MDVRNMAIFGLLIQILLGEKHVTRLSDSETPSYNGAES